MRSAKIICNIQRCVLKTKVTKDGVSQELQMSITVPEDAEGAQMQLLKNKFMQAPVMVEITPHQTDMTKDLGN